MSVNSIIMNIQIPQESTGNKVKNRWALATTIYLLGSVLIFLTSILHNDVYSISEVCSYWGTIVIGQFILFLILFYSRYKTINNPYIYFIFAAFICWFGQIITTVLKLKTDSPLIINTFNPVEFYATLQYGTISFFALCVVGLLFSNKVSYANFTSKINDKLLRKSMNYVGGLLALMGAYGYISVKITDMITSLTYGYATIFQSGKNGLMVLAENSNNIISNSGMLFVPGIMILLIANKGNKKVGTILSLVLLLSIIISFITGGRSEAFAIIVGLLWIYSSEIKKINLKRFIILLALGLLFVKIITVTSQFRVMQDRSLDTFINLLFSNQNSLGQSIGNMLSEFGFNIFSLHETMNIIPAVQNYSFGYTYFAAIMAIIPSFFFGGYSFSTAASLPNWLMNILHMNYGPGFSLTAESYYNFGWSGVIAMIAFGLILVKMLSNNHKNADFKSLQNGFIAIILYSNLFIARDTSLLVFRKYFYTVLLPLILITIIYNIYLRKRESV